MVRWTEIKSKSWLCIRMTEIHSSEMHVRWIYHYYQLHLVLINAVHVEYQQLKKSILGRTGWQKEGWEKLLLNIVASRNLKSFLNSYPEMYMDLFSGKWCDHQCKICVFFPAWLHFSLTSLLTSLAPNQVRVQLCISDGMTISIWNCVNTNMYVCTV
jgi:hypothetical protein